MAGECRPAVAALLAALRDPEFVAEMRRADDDAAEIVAFWEQIRDVEEQYRHETLVWFARSPWWHPCGMILADWQGKLHRAAWKALQKDLGANTPGRRWNATPHSLGRASIARLLGQAGTACPGYVTAPFRTWIDDDDRSWIAGAVGCPPCFDVDAVMHWRHLDIDEIILWCPRTGEARLAGEDPSTVRMILPCDQGASLTVWGDAGAFFRAWAQRRAGTADKMRRKTSGEWVHPVTESPDGEMPGALVVGDIGKLRWGNVRASTIVAGPGMTRRDLHAAALRAASLPAFVDGGAPRGA